MPSFFEEHPWWSLGLVLLCGGIAHRGAEKLPLHYYTPALMLVAILALSAVVILIVARNRDRSRLDTRTQTHDELILVATFGLWWFCILLAVRWYLAKGDATIPQVTNQDYVVAPQPMTPEKVFVKGVSTLTMSTRTRTIMQTTRTHTVRVRTIEKWLF
ncbi:hypothetical protein BKA62DRAFT_241636 [Auriculariales sp. MPI-PUGE-AT-0066]|nr:hypothetical protein BKA62DRAFT_241636 [Auriculariales sp. MPI-PUGE-AT-0066]